MVVIPNLMQSYQNAFSFISGVLLDFFVAYFPWTC
jgi:hypothetical protein